MPDEIASNVLVDFVEVLTGHYGAVELPDRRTKLVRVYKNPWAHEKDSSFFYVSEKHVRAGPNLRCAYYLSILFVKKIIRKEHCIPKKL